MQVLKKCIELCKTFVAYLDFKILDTIGDLIISMKIIFIPIKCNPIINLFLAKTYINMNLYKIGWWPEVVLITWIVTEFTNNFVFMVCASTFEINRR